MATRTHTNVPRIAFSRNHVGELSEFKGEPAWLRQARIAAWVAYETLTGGALDLRLPDHRGTVNLESLLPFVEPPRYAAPVSEWPRDLPHAFDERGDEEGLVIQRDSTVLSRSISKEMAKRGVIFTDLESAVKAVPDLVRKYIGTQVRPTSPASALNAAFWSGGTFIFVPATVNVLLPFHTCFWMSMRSAALFPRTLLVTERESRVCHVDEYLSPDWQHPGLSAAVGEIWVGDRARVHAVNLTNWGDFIAHTLDRSNYVSQTGRLTIYDLELGGRDSSRGTSVTTWTGEIAETLPHAALEDRAGFERLLRELPVESLREKLRYAVTGRLTGHRPTMTLEKVAELHPEIRH